MYVDDFKMSGPKDGLKESWAAMRHQGLKMDDPAPAGHYLGCMHKMSKQKMDGGVMINVIEYDMEDYLQNVVVKYKNLCAKSNFQVKMKKVSTPFIPEDHKASPQSQPCAPGRYVTCPWCKNTVPCEEEIQAAIAALQSFL